VNARKETRKGISFGGEFGKMGEVARRAWVWNRGERVRGKTNLEKSSDSVGSHGSVLIGDHVLHLVVARRDGGRVGLSEFVEGSDGGELESGFRGGKEELKD